MIFFKKRNLISCFLRGLTVVMLAVVFSAINAPAEERARPLWEVGVVGGYISWPQYIGSDQQYAFPAATPYFIYRGKILRADRDGVRGILYSRTNMALDLGFSMNLPVTSDENDARYGMPDLPISGEIGPRLLLMLHRFENGLGLLARIPVRLVGDINGHTIGWTAEPNLLVSEAAPVGGWGYYLNIGLLYGSVDYNNTYYGVAEEYATDDRPAFEATGGIHSYFATVGLSYRSKESLIMGIYAKNRFLGGGVVVDSPLVKAENDVALGVWFAWSFLNSSRTERESAGAQMSDEDQI